MATSPAFIAKLPEIITDEQLEKRVRWAKSTSVKSDVIMAKDGAMQLICFRKEPQSTRQYQRLLRTLMVKWL